MTQTSWHASITFTDVPAAELTDDQADALAGVGGYAIAAIRNGTLRLELTVDAGTLGAAADTALRQARAAYATAYRTQGKPTGLRVVTEEQHLAEIAHPPTADLVGYKEAGPLLGVTYQRVQQLAKREDFPAPIATLAMGPVYTRASIEAFDKVWERRTGRPPKAHQL